MPPAAKRTQFDDYDEYQFASEIAIRILQRTEGVTLDQVLCDPAIAVQFDKIAQQLAPTQSPLKLRWAALNLRKTRRLGPSKLKEAPDYDLVPAGSLKRLAVNELPRFPATYVLYDVTRPIFAGETANLQKRVELHLANGLPQWLDAAEGLDFQLRHSAVPAANQDERLRWLGRFIFQEKPLLNYQKVA